MTMRHVTKFAPGIECPVCHKLTPVRTAVEVITTTQPQIVGEIIVWRDNAYACVNCSATYTQLYTASLIDRRIYSKEQNMQPYATDDVFPPTVAAQKPVELPREPASAQEPEPATTYGLGFGGEAGSS